jgi:uncharacterized integral membrane protein
MPWRLIGFIIIFGVFLAFIAFNLGNTCDISFGFHTFKAVPVFLTAFTSFILGMFCTVPFMFGVRGKKKRKTEKETGASQKKGGKKDGETGASGGAVDNGFSGGGPYGID